MGSYAEPKIPIFKFNEASLTPGSSSWKLTSDSVRRALETYGCLVVSNEKTRPEHPHESLFSVLAEVFDLPDETKKKYTSQLGGFGYGGRYPRMPHLEYFGIEDEGDFEGVKNFTTLMWPHGNDKFCETICSHSKTLVVQVNETIMKMVTSSYGLEKYNDWLSESSFYMIRLIKYNSPNSSESSTGLRAHKDKGFVSVLCSNEIEGLQLQNRDGEWMDFQQSPSKFIVLAGEALTAWSNGRIHSPTHRVITRGFKERYCLGVFGFVGGMVQVPQELVDDQNPLKFKPFDNIDFIQYCKDGGSTIDHAIQSYCGI
ncbi:probable 2-oxoglutarate-dependent dioxygenase AOP1 [Salvia miltiorrhiza]|uniref:probable 2-oxoglutarate-dependent dioxygenase AOP1 n=1 Tax=Salvia miltiorrhiza TaxID=226208 RepID=UPI0025ABBFD4|nr:probable 2-oxoglutarate-dependent dioxygenase AOP1 [Salvia miltiorrhiza]